MYHSSLDFEKNNNITLIDIVEQLSVMLPWSVQQYKEEYQCNIMIQGH